MTNQSLLPCFLLSFDLVRYPLIEEFSVLADTYGWLETNIEIIVLADTYGGLKCANTYWAYLDTCTLDCVCTCVCTCVCVCVWRAHVRVCVCVCCV